MNMFNNMSALKNMMGNVGKVQAALKNFEITGRAGQDLVIIKMKKNQNMMSELVDIKIKPELIAKNDPAMVERLVKEALNDAFSRELSELSKVIDPKTLGGLTE